MHVSLALSTVNFLCLYPRLASLEHNPLCHNGSDVFLVDGIRFSFVRSVLLLAVVLCWVGRCYGSWVQLGFKLFRLARVTQWYSGHECKVFLDFVPCGCVLQMRRTQSKRPSVAWCDFVTVCGGSSITAALIFILRGTSSLCSDHCMQRQWMHSTTA